MECSSSESFWHNSHNKEILHNAAEHRVIRYKFVPKKEDGKTVRKILLQFGS